MMPHRSIGMAAVRLCADCLEIMQIRIANPVEILSRILYNIRDRACLLYTSSGRCHIFSGRARSSVRTHSSTSTTVNSSGVRRITTRASPALMTMRRHMGQEVASVSSSPVWALRPTRYSVPPTMSRRLAEMMALASAWTLRHSS